MVRDDPVDAGNDARCRAIARAIEHAHGNQRDGLGYSIGCAADCAGHMRAVAVAVFGPDSRIDARIHIARSHPTAELLVRTADSRIDDIRRHPGTGGCI